MAHYAGKNFILDLCTLQFARKVGKAVVTPDDSGTQGESVRKSKIELTVFSGEGSSDIIDVEFVSPMERDAEYALLTEAIRGGDGQASPFACCDPVERSLSAVLGGVVEYLLGPTVTSKPSQGK